MMRPYSCLCLASLLVSGAAAAAEHDCLIEARQRIDLRSPVEAVVESVQVQRGDSVKKGQIVATLESGPERAALDLAKSRASMSGELKSAEARVDLTQKKRLRAEELYKQNFVSVNARDEAEADYRLSIEQLRQARENQKLAELEMQRSAEVLAMRTIRSPLSGIVVEVMLKPGEFSSSNLKEPILKLAEVDPLYVEVILPVTMYGKIKNGQHAQVVPEQPIGGSYDAVVKVVDRVIDAASGTFGVRLQLPNPNYRIPAGIKCRAKFL
ncbi:MAG: efflux RND transporter periplasmic adaptor subunit [Betaproteobacteria bacterium]|jgi:RND family efflux transporter MFP subunit